MKKREALPNLFTVGNLFCGFLAIYYATEGRLVPAGWLIVIAAFLDAMDGKVARAMKTPSRFGVEFDSLADVCSFGLAPAVLIFNYHCRVCALDDVWGMSLSFLFLLCGALRLARFNAQQKGFDKKNFSGLPIPSASATLVSFVIFNQKFWEGPKSLEISITLTLLLSFLMVSTIQYDTFPRFAPGSAWNRVKLAYFLIGAVLTVLYAEAVFFPLALIYVMSGLARRAFLAFSHREVADIRSLDDVGSSV
jgi:CDP-diacylglycerol--serine O-phosphatidyltransferase